MSNISDVVERIPVAMQELFPAKTRIPYPYFPERNNARFMNDGWGMIIGSANFEQLETCGFVVNRQISIIFTRSMFRLESKTQELDDIIEGLLEDVYTVQKSFYNQSQLDISEKIARVDIVDVSAPTEVNSEKESFLSMTASFNFWIFEQL